MVGQHLKQYVESWGFQSEDVPKIVGVFVGAKYFTLGAFVVVGARYQPLRRLFPRRERKSHATWERVRHFMSQRHKLLQSRLQERAQHARIILQARSHERAHDAQKNLRKRLHERARDSLRQKWGGWYIWIAQKYWYLSDKMQSSLQKSRALSAIIHHTGGNPVRVALGVAEGFVLCKVTFPLWGPLELWAILRVLKQHRGSREGQDAPGGDLMEQYSQAAAASEDAQELTGGPL